MPGLLKQRPSGTSVHPPLRKGRTHRSAPTFRPACVGVDLCVDPFPCRPISQFDPLLLSCPTPTERPIWRLIAKPLYSRVVVVRPIGRATLEAGGRFTWIRQQNDDGPTFDDSAWTGFAGAVIPLGRGFELSANVGTGFRFPNLSERFFTGTTGRGEIVGNPNLNAEESFNTDLRLAWFGKRLFFETDVFRNEIDDYVERIELTDDVLTFVNLTSGTLEGFEFEGFFELRPGWRLSWGGHTIEGEDSTGRPLADVPPDRIFLALRKSPGRESPWSWGTRLEQRSDKTDVGSGEAPIPEATLLSATVGYELRPGLSLSLSGGNLLDEEYVSSADDKAPLAEGRSFGLAVEWRR